MANPTKKLEAHAQAGALVRVYMDITTEVNAGLEMLAQSFGRTKKGQLEFMIREAVAERAALDAEASKREGGKRRKKGAR